VSPSSATNPWVAIVALALCAAVSVVLVVRYPDSYQQDGGTHYLFARWAWVHPRNLVDVWGRPLFTLLYSGPAVLGGYRAAKLLTVAVAVATAWQTWRLAIDYGLESPALVIPLLWLQPSFLLLSSETMTEPLFALLLVIVLRLQHRQKRSPAALLVSATSLVRPEGFFVNALWGIGLLLERRDAEHHPVLRRWGTVALLGTFPALWWLAALLIMRDPLYILHNWPPNWSASVATYGRGPALEYFWRRGEILGPLLMYPFAVGVLAVLVRARGGLALAAVAAFAVVHSILRATGTFGSAGYPRYFVCVAPAIAIVTLFGWNALAAGLDALLKRRARVVAVGVATIVFGISLVSDLCYVDDMPWTRDSRLVDASYAWFRAHPRTVAHFAASQAYMCIEFGCDPDQRVITPGPRAETLARLRAAPPETLVVWDADTGPAFYDGVTADSVAAAGYTVLYAVSDSLAGQILPRLGNGRYVPTVTNWRWGGLRGQRVSLLYR